MTASECGTKALPSEGARGVALSGHEGDGLVAVDLEVAVFKIEPARVPLHSLDALLGSLLLLCAVPAPLEGQPGQSLAGRSPEKQFTGSFFIPARPSIANITLPETLRYATWRPFNCRF